MTLLLMGIAAAFNFVVIITKYRRQRYMDATLDFSLLVIICIIFSGSFSALATGTVASAIISIYLFIFPVTLAGILGEDKKQVSTRKAVVDSNDW